MKSPTKTWLLAFLMMFGISWNTWGQVTITNPTNVTPNLTSTYTSLNDALLALNATTAMTGPVVLTLDAGYSETAPTAAGFVLGSATLNPVLSATNTITIIKAAGAATVLNAAAGGTGTPASTTPDGIFSIRGADFVTIDGLTFTDGNTANPATMEFGVGLFKASAGDGANNNTIQNCIFNMQRVNNASGSTPTVEGSVGILVINSIATAATTALTPTNGGTLATNGTNSGNRFYTNTINGGNYGIVLNGFAATVGVGPTPVSTTFLGDLGNDIGGIAAGTGNTILNFGGAAAATNPSAGIRANNQWSINVSFNTVNNNNGTGVNHVSTLRGIFAQAGVSANATINNNTVTVRGAGTSSLVTAIENGIGATPLLNTVNINNNTIVDCAVTSTGSSSAFIGVTNSASASNVNINNNIVRGYTSTSTGAFTGIVNSGGVGVAVNINNNAIGDGTAGAFNYSVASSSAIVGVSSTGTLVTNATISIANNDFRGFVHTLAATSTHTYINLTGATAAGVIATVQNNTFTNLSINSTGTTTFINHNYAISATGQMVINNNAIVTAFAKTAVGAVTLTSTNSFSVTGSINNYTNNNFSNITVTGASTLTGFNNTDGGAGSTKTITGNTFNNWTAGINAVNIMNFTYWNGVSSLSNNTITNITGQGAITGVTIGNSANNATSITVSGNTISNLVSTGTGGSVVGITCNNTSTGIVITNNTINTLSSTGTTATIQGIIIGGTNAAGTIISRNKIYDLSGNQAGSIVNGISVTLATLLTISNNLIGDLRASAATGTNAINGINASATATYNVFYNTIHLNATSSSVTTFGTSCITFSSTVTSFNLRNNILVNVSTPGATGGITAVLRRSAGTNGTVPTNYATTSNNNLYWVNPTAGVTNYLTYVEGNVIGSVTNPMNTFAQMKAFMVNRDQNSVTENINFVSTSGASVDFLRPTGATQAESGAAAIGGLTDAYNALAIRTGYPLAAQVNGGGFSPDMGAYEGDFIFLDIVAPNITYTALSNICLSTPSRVLVATITDLSGVPTSGAGLPMLYWRINAGVYTGVQGVSLGGNQYEFTFGGTTVANDVVSYYIVAQDAFATPNAGAFPSVGATGFSVNPPAVSTPPTTPTIYTHGAGLTGTYTVGVTGNYPTLTAAVAAFNGGCANGAVVFELIDTTYPSETFPIVINQVPNAVTNTLTIRPSSTVGAVNFVGNNASSLIDLNGADYVTINGVNGTSTLTISNTAVGTTANTIRLFGDATFNTITNTTVLGSGTALGSAVINLGSVVATGNNNNTITNNTISAAGTNLPLSGLVSFSGSTIISNSQNTLTGNNFADIFNAASEFSAVNINVGNNAWTINNNKIYQTAPRTITTANTSSGIFISSGNAHTVNNNVIGFADNAGTGITTYTSTVAFLYRAIFLQTTVAGAPINIQGNTIANITMTTASTSAGMFIGIFNSGAADVNIGTVTGNTIGSNTSTGVINVTSSAATTAGTVIGINNTGTGIINISNNIVGGITASGSTTAFTVGITGIASTNGTNTITNNTIGSTTVANSINAVTASTTGTQGVLGISVTSGITTISNNTIANMTQSATTTASFIRGIYYGGFSASTINQNTIRNLSGVNTLAGQSSGGSSIQGIRVWSSTGAATEINQNTISALSATNTGTVSTLVAAITVNAAGVTNITRNQIFGLSNASTGTTATAPPMAVGVMVVATVDSPNIINNMIALGTGQTTNTSFIGIMNIATNTLLNVYHNSVSISGTVTAGALSSFGLLRANFSTTAVTTSVDIKNNVFVNTRIGGTGEHYAISNNFGATTASATGWGANASNFNVLFSSGANVAHWTSTTTYTAWQTASAGDVNSINSNVNFVNASIGDLHITTPFPSAVEGAGTNIASVTIDFDGDVRGSNTPVDIGADAGNFSNIVIVYTPLANSCVAGARTITATITSANGIPTSGAGLPVLYWRIGAGAYQTTIATSLGSNQYEFSIGTGSVGSDVISYYIVAQDNLNNVNASPSLGATGLTANPPAVTTPPTAPQTYTNVPSLSGTYLVGAGQTYTTLTAAVNAYNVACLTGPVTFLLNDATYPSETFPIVINANAQASTTNTLTIKPNVSVNATISGNNATAIIRLNGADFVNIDGSNTVGGTTRNLTIVNTNTGTTGTVVWINSVSVSNASINNSIRNSIIQGNDGLSTLGSIIISGSVLGNASETPNNNITISNNQLSKAQNGVFAIGNTTTPEQGWIISNNNIGSAVTTEQSFRGIAVQNAQGVVVNNNQIAGISTTTTSTASGILLGATINGGTISNNQISNVSNTNTGGWGSNGLYLNATNVNTNLNIFNNVILNVFSNGFGGWAQGDNGYGIMVNAGGGYNIYYNTINLNTNQTTAGNSAAINIAVGSNLNIRNNIFANTQTTGTRYAIYSAVANSAFTAINYNNYFVSTGSAGIGFLGSARVTLANWQTATAQDANSLNTDPVFTSPTNLLPTSCRLDNKGVTIAGITTDIAAVVRNVTTPDIGAYEFTPVLTISPATLPNATLNVLYNQTLTQTGILGAVTWTLSAGALPTGITLSSAGVLSGTSSVAGTFNFTVQATDGFCTNTTVYTLVVDCPTSITFGTAPVNGTAGTAYTHTLGQTGLGTVTWSVGAGLPTGLSLDATTGIISGTPTVSGTYNFTVQVQQSTCSYTQGYAIVIGCPVITFSPLSLPNGLVNTLYTPQVLSASAPGLPNDYTITLTTGSVPGMSFDSPTATWSGTPTTQGTYTLTFTAAHNTANCSTTYTYNFVVACATVTITPLLPAATVGTAFSQVISQTGANPPFTWSLSAGTLPAGIGFDGATGTLSGTPTEAGTFNITISLDLGGCVVPQPYAWVINCPTIVFPNTTAVNAVAGASYTLNATTTGTTQTPTYSVSPALPTGLTLDGATGQITGIPTVTAVSTTYTVTVSQTGGVCTKTQDYTFAVNCPTIVLNPATLPSPTVGNTYNQTVSTTGNASAVTFAVSSGALPAGIMLNTTTGVLSGAPSVSGAFSFDITATQANGPCTVTRSYTWNIVCPTVSINTNSLANGTINIAYPAVTLTQTGYTGTFSWAATGLPTGFTLNPTTGDLSGTSATFGVYNVSVTLTQGICSVTKVLTLQILSSCPAITVAPAQMPMGNVGTGYPSTSIVATGGTAPYIYTVSSGTSLPLGLTLSPAGVISGTPTTTGTLNVNITATDANGCNGSTFYLITINGACTAITITPTTLNAGIIGTFYNQTLTSTGGTAPYSYTVTTGTLPTGLALGTSGSITGTTTFIGTSTFSVRVVDAIGCIGTANYTVVVNPVPTRVISISPVTLNFPDVIIGQSITSTFTITNNGNTPLTISGIQYPIGFSGNFTGTIAAAGSQIVTVTFAPNVVGAFGGTVIVNSNALSGISTLTINGNGISNPTSIDNFGKPIVTVYPNPSADDFNVRFDNNWKGDYIVKVLDMSGKVVFEDKAEITDTVDEIQLRLGHLANGAYLLHLENKRGKTAIRIVRR